MMRYRKESYVFPSVSSPLSLVCISLTTASCCFPFWFLFSYFVCVFMLVYILMSCFLLSLSIIVFISSQLAGQYVHFVLHSPFDFFPLPFIFLSSVLSLFRNHYNSIAKLQKKKTKETSFTVNVIEIFFHFKVVVVSLLPLIYWLVLSFTFFCYFHFSFEETNFLRKIN